MNKEVWKDIKGFEGLYQVSNLGRVKSLTVERTVRSVKRRSGNIQDETWTRSERILKPICSYNSTLYVSLYRLDHTKDRIATKVIVARNFLDFPEDSPTRYVRLIDKHAAPSVANIKIRTT